MNATPDTGKLTWLFASISLVLGIAGATALSKFVPTGTPAVPDISTRADICTADRLCDGYQMRIAMSEDGKPSLNSPVGKALKAIAAEGNVDDSSVLELMGALDQNFRYSKNVATFVEAEGIFAIRPAQFKANPALPQSVNNAFLKANFDMVVVLAKPGCPSFTVRPDGTFTSIAGPESLMKRVGSHAVSSDECAEKRDRFMNKMGINLS